MESIKEKLQFHRKHNKRALMIAGIAWKVLVTMIMIEKCRWPEDLSIRKWNDTEVPWGHIQCETDSIHMK